MILLGHLANGLSDYPRTYLCLDQTEFFYHWRQDNLHLDLPMPPVYRFLILILVLSQSRHDCK